MSPQNLNRRSWHILFASAVVFGFTPFCQPGHATAQVLNSQVEQLLANKCEGLLGASQAGITAGLGKDLAFK